MAVEATIVELGLFVVDRPWQARALDLDVPHHAAVVLAFASFKCFSKNTQAFPPVTPQHFG
jgi:hypothetical protein